MVSKIAVPIAVKIPVAIEEKSTESEECDSRKEEKPGDASRKNLVVHGSGRVRGV